MSDLACVLLGIYPIRKWSYGQLIEVGQQWLIAFHDPERGLTASDPCYIDRDVIQAYHPYDPETGEFKFDDTEYGPGIIRLPDMLWHDMPNRIAKVITERERMEKAEANAARKAAEKNPQVARRTEDRMLRARRRKRQLDLL